MEPSSQQTRQNSAGTIHHHHYVPVTQPPPVSSAQMKPEYTLDTYIPATSMATQQNGYYAEPVRSNPGSPSKRVAFKGEK